VSIKIKVGGPSTPTQSFKAVKIDGLISLIRFLAVARKKSPSFRQVLHIITTVRGAHVGSWAQLEDVVCLIRG
jgi:hypothetical protein